MDGRAGPPPEGGVGAAEVQAAAAGRTVAVAESLTGGAVLDALVAVPGASSYLRGGVVAYATDVKTGVLGVPADLVERVGAVDPEVALAMAEGVRRLLGADVGVGTTGVAGPTPQDGRTPGDYHVAVVGPGERRTVRSFRTRVPGREAIRAHATADAVRALRDALADTGWHEPEALLSAPGNRGTRDEGGALHRS